MITKFKNSVSGPVNKEVFNRLQAFPSFASYDYVKRNGLMVLALGSCTDMAGCIEYFQRIDPDVEFIVTFSDDAGKTIYAKYEGEWRASVERSVPSQLKFLATDLREQMLKFQNY